MDRIRVPGNDPSHRSAQVVGRSMRSPAVAVIAVFPVYDHRGTDTKNRDSTALGVSVDASALACPVAGVFNIETIFGA